MNKCSYVCRVLIVIIYYKFVDRVDNSGPVESLNLCRNDSIGLSGNFGYHLRYICLVYFLR